MKKGVYKFILRTYPDGAWIKHSSGSYSFEENINRASVWDDERDAEEHAEKASDVFGVTVLLMEVKARYKVEMRRVLDKKEGFIDKEKETENE